VLACAAIAGAGAGRLLMCGIALSHGCSPLRGAVAGSILIGLLAHGVAADTMSVITLVAVLVGLFFALIGAGYDDYGGLTVFPAAFLGALAAWLVRSVARSNRRNAACKTQSPGASEDAR